MLKEFTSFLTKSNALALAVGVIIGGATGKVVSSVADDLLMPGIATVLPPGDWREAQYVISSSKDANGKTTVNSIKYGHFIGSVVDFTIISFVVFMITKNLLPKEKTPEAPATKVCKECLETIPEKATRCKSCGVVQVA
jgi:large conductance mechanosensitive channel